MSIRTRSLWRISYTRLPGFRPSALKRTHQDTGKEKKEGSINVPFNDSAYISSFDDTVKHRYGEALDRVCQFVTWHLNPEMRGWFVKACLDIIDNDEDIEDDEVFYVRGDGSTISKSGLRTESIFELQPFLLGILHYVLVWRANKNSLGIPTLDANSDVSIPIEFN